MTPDQINAKCAEVMGLYPTPEGYWTTNPARRISIEYKWFKELPNFTGSHDAAMQFVEHLKESGIRITMTNYTTSEWLVTAHPSGMWKEGPNLPALICEVGLRALGVWSTE